MKSLNILMFTPRQVLLIGGICYFILGYLTGSCVRMIAGGVFALAAVLFWEWAIKASRLVGRMPQILRYLMLGGGTFVYYFSSTMMPAQAMFLGKLCGLMKDVVDNTSNTGGGNTIGNLVQGIVNVVRALFILYLAIALISVFNQLQRDEEWQAAARTPLLAVVIVGIVEAISNLIVPGTVTNC
jgi:hypothetical protein